MKYPPRRFNEEDYGQAKIISMEIVELAAKIDAQLLQADVPQYVDVKTSKLLVLADRLRALVVRNK